MDQALSNENWGASGTMLADIAQASYNEYGTALPRLTHRNDYKVISDAIWKTLAVQPKYWKQIFKVVAFAVFHDVGSEPDRSPDSQWFS